MAQYDRKILIPYLQDVCSMELLCAKITREINESLLAEGTPQKNQ